MTVLRGMERRGRFYSYMEVTINDSGRLDDPRGAKTNLWSILSRSCGLFVCL